MPYSHESAHIKHAIYHSKAGLFKVLVVGIYRYFFISFNFPDGQNICTFLKKKNLNMNYLVQMGRVQTI